MHTEPLAPVTTLVAMLIEAESAGTAGLATRIGVNPATVSRWQTGEARPRPELEGRLRALAAKRLSLSRRARAVDAPVLFSTSSDPLDQAFAESLHDVREALHRNGRLSSRHEALDELAKLVFAHFASIESGGPGLGGISRDGGGVADSLRQFVEEQFTLHLPTSIAHEFQADDFRLRLKPTEDRLARDLIQCFTPLSPDRVGRVLQGANDADLLNDTFGRFLADSFTDEKELGQYLTPPEVIRAMTRIGLASLSNHDQSALLDPARCRDAGIILDPSCGVGSFLAEAVRQLLVEAETRLDPAGVITWLSQMTTGVVVGLDKSDRMLKLALTGLALFGAPSVNLHLVNSLALGGADGKVTASFANRARLILTNPPFGAEFAGDDLRGYALGRVLAKSDRTIASELLFLERYLQWLAPGGVLVAVVPDSVLTNRGLFKAIRAWMAPQVELCSVISLPPVTFGVAGTNTKTSILHLRKRSRPSSDPARVYFAICNDIGFDVVSRGSQRQKQRRGEGELPHIAVEAVEPAGAVIGRVATLDQRAERWDATYHSGLPSWLEQAIATHGDVLLCLRDVADIVNDRFDPRRLGDETFRYIEISDVGARDCAVHAKDIPSTEAPSRARKMVRAGDVLLSTVRPDRRTIGTVPIHLDRAVCSTGLAVIRPRQYVDGVLLARLLQTDFVTLQLLRNNIGIAYPAIDEECLTDVILPLTQKQAETLVEATREVDSLREQLSQAEARLLETMTRETQRWLTQT